MSRVVDLRSDTVTKPSEAMRRAMANAEVGDDVYGEDSTVRRLEEFVADLLGKEAALYAPSGTMTNQIALHLATRRGDEVLLHEDAHIFNYEAGAPALISGVQVRTVPGEGGVISPEGLRAATRPENVHFAPPTLLCLENTHNMTGGRIFPVAEYAEVAAAARSLGLKVHLDGARLFNAAVATKTPASAWCDLSDTVSVCSSKGLGAPVGSLLAGDSDTLNEALRIRKAFGGGMRQAGIIAAASLYAFENNIERLSEDHERAARLAAGLRNAGYDVETPETNIVLLRTDRADVLIENLRKAGVLVGAGKPGYVRLCTHLDLTDDDIETTIAAAERMSESLVK